MSHPNIKQVRMMSDGCGGQQKNVIFASMCILLCENHPELESIDHKFFETGHTEMECDSIHSKIEKKSKNVPVYVPEGWAQLIRTCRNNPRPFVVNTMLNVDFLDFKAHSKMIPKIPMRSICWLHYEKSNPLSLFYKTEFNQPFQEVVIRRTPGRPSNPRALIRAYKEKFPVSAPKYKDLCTMCDKLMIPREHHAYYRSFNTLPEPDNDETSEEELV